MNIPIYDLGHFTGKAGGRKEVKRMKRTSERELLRQQIELLAEESKDIIPAELPRLTNAMCEVHKELRICSCDFALGACFFFVCANLVISFVIQIKKLFWSKL